MGREHADNRDGIASPAVNASMLQLVNILNLISITNHDRSRP